MSTNIVPPTTAGICPEKFSGHLAFARGPRVVTALLLALILIAFGLRVTGLGSESLGEDELNKLQTVEEYRTNGLSGKNGEHPFLMKGLQTVSIVAVERVSSILPAENAIPAEAALRFPIALFGSFTVLILFLLVSELFGRSIGIVSAALWAVEPLAIGFDRIAKEDSLVLFFFLLTNYFWVRGQTAAETGDPKWTRWAWAAAAGFAALMASKYYPFLLAVLGAYYIIFKSVPNRHWDMGKARWITFFAVMGVSFLLLNPTIVLPDTWREMLKFSSENRIGHDSYEFMGELYRNQMSAFLSGVPWTFFFVFAAVKTSLPTLVLFAIGLPLIFLRRLGDGRFLIFFWACFWLISYTFIGGKFTRYFTTFAPVIMICAAIGFYFIAKQIGIFLGKSTAVSAAAQWILLTAAIAVPLANSVSSTPHFRLFTNSLGGGNSSAGSYFPHDEFYDLSTREIITEIAKDARHNAVVACETPALFEYYAKVVGRPDLQMISLSDAAKIGMLGEGDYVVAAKGRRYFSNSKQLAFLGSTGLGPKEIKAGDTVSALIYKLDAAAAAGIKSPK